MYYYLMLKFKEISKGKFDINYLGKKLFIFFIITILVNFAVIFYSIFIKNPIIGGLPLLLLGFSFLYFRSQFEKVERLKVDRNIESYKGDLDTFRTMLKQHDLYSKKQLEYLVELLADHKKAWKFSDNFFKPLTSLSSISITPVIFMFLQWVYDNSSDTIEVMLFTTIVVLLLLSVAAFVYMVYPTIKIYLDKDYSDFCSMQQWLQDIILLDFYKE